jgi:V/A-type H+-transporting ATPase subunit K
MILVLLPATQGLYGFVIAIIGAGNVVDGMTLAQGWEVFAYCLPMMIAGMTSAIFQGKTSATTIMAAGKKPEIAGKAMLFPAMIEFYALLGLVVSIILLG